MMIYGPISESMEEFRHPGNETFKGWMAIHEVSHSLLEGGNSLVAKGALSSENEAEMASIA